MQKVLFYSIKFHMVNLSSLDLLAMREFVLILFADLFDYVYVCSTVVVYNAHGCDHMIKLIVSSIVHVHTHHVFFGITTSV